MKLVRSGLGENLNSPVAQFVILRGKRILIDADFTDGSFGRKRAGSKTVDIHLATIRACGWPGQRLKFGLQLIGIIRKRFEVLALHDDHAGVVRRCDIHFRGRIADFHFLLFHLNEETDIQLFSLSGQNLDIFLR